MWAARLDRQSEHEVALVPEQILVEALDHHHIGQHKNGEDQNNIGKHAHPGDKVQPLFLEEAELQKELVDTGEDQQHPKKGQKDSGGRLHFMPQKFP